MEECCIRRVALDDDVDRIAQRGPFTAMAGMWSGGGRIDLSDGQTERIRVAHVTMLVTEAHRCVSICAVQVPRRKFVAYFGQADGRFVEAAGPI
jgi:hypothetical protein